MVTEMQLASPMPGLTEPGWSMCNRSDGGGGVMVGWNTPGLPMHRPGSLGWAWATVAPPFMNTISIPSMSGACSDD